MWGGYDACQHEWAPAAKAGTYAHGHKSGAGSTLVNPDWNQRAPRAPEHNGEVCVRCQNPQGHEHAWRTATKSGISGGTASPKVQTKGAENFQVVPPTEHATCDGCGAWRGSLGNEPTPELYVEHLVAVFRACRRVLRDDGTLWLNLGDSYWGAQGREPAIGADHKAQQVPQSGLRHAYLKPKDLIMIPFLVAIALQRDGWWVRSDVCWAKGASFGPYVGNVMPESIRDRPTKSHEYLFLLAKSPTYHFDMDAIKEPLAASSFARMAQSTFDFQTGGEKDYGATGTNPNMSSRRALENVRRAWGLDASGGYRGTALKDYDGALAQTPGDVKRSIARRLATYAPDKQWKHDTEARGGKRSANRAHGDPASVARMALGRHVRSVWTIGPEPFGGAHFAVFPTRLIEPVIRAGTSEKGACGRCGAPWERVVHRNVLPSADRANNNPFKHDGTTTHGEGAATPRNLVESATVAWRPTCPCEPGPLKPCVVLDPFGGSGTTAQVALRFGRDAVLIELNPAYVEVAQKRLAHAGHLGEKRLVDYEQEAARA